MLVAQSCPTLGDPMDCSPPGSSVHGVLQARILECIVMPSFRGSSQPRIKPRSPTLQADSLPSDPPGKHKNTGVGSLAPLQGILPTPGSNPGLLQYRQTLLSEPPESKTTCFSSACLSPAPHPKKKIHFSPGVFKGHPSKQNLKMQGYATHRRSWVRHFTWLVTVYSPRESHDFKYWVSLQHCSKDGNTLSTPVALMLYN